MDEATILTLRRLWDALPPEVRMVLAVATGPTLGPDAKLDMSAKGVDVTFNGYRITTAKINVTTAAKPE